MSHLTAPRAAVIAAVLAVVAPIVATNALIAFYLTCVALAGMMGATFLAYLGVVDHPSTRSILDLIVCSGAMLLLMFDAAIRFPTILDGTAPALAGSFALAGLVVAAVGALAELAITLDVDELRDHLRTRARV